MGRDHRQILILRGKLRAAKVGAVAIQATSAYWKLICYLFEDVRPVMLLSAKAAHSIPGRKTDVSDAAWLAQLGAHGQLRPCFVPRPPIGIRWDSTLARTIAVDDRAREAQCLYEF